MGDAAVGRSSSGAATAPRARVPAKSTTSGAPTASARCIVKVLLVITQVEPFDQRRELGQIGLADHVDRPRADFVDDARPGHDIAVALGPVRDHGPANAWL